MGSTHRGRTGGHYQGRPRRPLAALLDSAHVLETDKEPPLLTAAAVEAELAGPGGFDQDPVSSVLDAYLDEWGRLVPARSVERVPLGGESAERAQERARQLDGLRASAWSENTLKSYGFSLAAWRRWCDAHDVPPLPFTPSHVVDHLLDYAFTWDETRGAYATDAEGRLIAAHAAGSVTNRLAGLNKAAAFLGLPKPGDNEGVQGCCGDEPGESGSAGRESWVGSHF